MEEASDQLVSRSLCGVSLKVGSASAHVPVRTAARICTCCQM